MIARYRKKPVNVDAVQWNGENYSVVAALCPDVIWNSADDSLMINTLEGCMKANKGDWIIRGVKGECYPCKPDIFAATYEIVEVEDANL